MTEARNPETGLTIHQIVLIFVVVTLWISVFMGGILVNSEPYRMAVSNYSFIGTIAQTHNDQASIIFIDVFIAWLVVFFCYTPMNIMFLAMISGVLGALARIAKLHVKKEDEVELPSDKTNPLMSGLLRGVFVYLLIISGVLIINETPFINPTPTQYLRLAGFLSLLSFLLSYNPSRFRSFLAKGFDNVEGKIGGNK